MQKTKTLWLSLEGSAKVDSQGVGDCKKTNEGRYPFVGS